jgi:hypothetical protein
MGWILPVGTPGGINSGLGAAPAGSGIVRLGLDLKYLDPDSYRMWRAAAAAPPVEDLARWGDAQGASGSKEAIEALKDERLLIEDGPDVAGRVERLAVRLLGECLGNGPAPSPVFYVVGRNYTRLLVDACIFELLLRTNGVSSVASFGDAMDAVAPRADGQSCVEALTQQLPALVRSEVVRLDVAVR